MKHVTMNHQELWPENKTFCQKSLSTKSINITSVARNPETCGQKSRRNMARHNYQPLLESKSYLARNHQTYEASNCKHVGRNPAKCGQKS